MGTSANRARVRRSSRWWVGPRVVSAAPKAVSRTSRVMPLFGGPVVALGCSVGQGLTAFATLSFSAPVVLLSIAIGGALGLRHLIQGFRLRMS